MMDSNECGTELKAKDSNSEKHTRTHTREHVTVCGIY